MAGMTVAQARHGDRPTLTEFLAAAGVGPGGELVDAEVTAGLPAQAEVADVAFANCRFHGAVYAGAVLRRCAFEECRFTSCDLSEIRLTDCRFIGCRFEGCKALAVAWSAASSSPVAIDPMTFLNCRLDYGSFCGLDAARWVFSGCSLRAADFTDAVLAEADFSDSDLAQAIFVRCDLRRATFLETRSCQLDPRINRLTGAKFGSLEAAALLQVFGIELVD